MHKGGGMTPGGTVPGGGIAMPSGSFQKLEHNDYSISYPDNWQVHGDKSSAVTIAPVRSTILTRPVATIL